MTKEEARIVILEDALRQAQSTVGFLHNCLVNPDNGEMKGGYHYAYPEHTIQHLEEWQKLAPKKKEICFHSFIKENCPSCQENHRLHLLLWEAKEVLGYA